MKKQDLIDAIGEIDPRYVEEADMVQKTGRRRKDDWIRFVKLAGTAACLCLIVMAVKWTSHSGTDDTMKENGSQSQTISSNQSDSSGDSVVSNEESAGLLSSGMMAFDYQEIDNSAIQEADNEMALMSGDFKNLTVEELETYLGVRVVPEEIPDGFTLNEEGQPLGTFARKDGTIYYDQNVITYQNKKGDFLRITTSKCRSIHWDTNILSENTVGHYREKGTDCYEVGFQNGDVWFYLTGKGMTRDQFEEIGMDLFYQ